MGIKKIHGTISNVTDLSPTAKEVTLTIETPLAFVAGAFVNVFLEDEGETIRRAFSISSDDGSRESFTLSIRKSLKGRMSPLFWNKNMIGTPIEVMGPLGLNTADKMHSKRIFLFGFGIGVGVVKSLAAHFATRDYIKSVTIATGSRNNADVMYQEYFKLLTEQYTKVSIQYIVTKNDGATDFPEGYIQDHISDMDFTNADVYVCGQGVACNALQEKAKAQNPKNCIFFVEDFH